jgi:hypothetical protein
MEKRTRWSLALIGTAIMCALGAAVFAQNAEGPIARYAVRPLEASSARAMALSGTSSAATTIPMWSYTVVSPVDGMSYSGKLVGRSPFFNGARTTDVPTVIIPVKIDMPDGGVFDPTAADPTCSSAGTALSLTQNSPIILPTAFTMSGVGVGTAQYIDAFERASFWTNVSMTGDRYHTPLSPVTTLSAFTVSPPSGKGATFSTSPFGGCGKIGVMDINWFDPFVTGTIIPSLASQGVGPTVFPIFLFYNVVMSEGTPSLGSNCCILGYHGATGFPVQTYSPLDYDTTRIFSNTGDISVMSHEVGEWIEDPLGNNPTPAWGHIGQVSGCQTNLEDGDPLSGTLFPSVTMPNGHTYHPQELAYFSWFYRQAPPLGPNGEFSNNDTFTTGAGPVCH